METLLVVVCPYGTNGVSLQLATDSDLTIREFFREHPADAAMYTICPLVVAVALVGNAVVHDLSPLVPMAFAIGLTIYSVLVTRHHLAAAKLTRLQSGWTGVESNAD